ncbi:TRAP transporter small permease [Roseomonas sp. GC11]|uniref:TRAP transporter small permease n=1 Tax=Roseomonas sp. GC11 TaxID=2950546 RepID=UPI002108ED89|nr:TRAP transporter small permease [Roseomonas sp. GC11]MCQ4160986.1 TRAP transporter small permease [Roseomonas sp. GC11]
MAPPFPSAPLPASAGAGRFPSLLAISHGVERVIAHLCETVLLLTGSALMAVLAANVVARYLLESGGFDWAEEVPEQIFPWFIMAGVALAVQKGGHIAVEWLLGHLGRPGRRALLLAGHALVAAAYLALCWQSLVVAQIVAIETSPALGLPRSYGYWAVAAGCVLLSLGTLAIAARIALLGPEALPQPAPEDVPT